MVPGDAADGKRRTQAWMGGPVAPEGSGGKPGAKAQAPAPEAKAARWMPSDGELPSYPGGASPSGSHAAVPPTGSHAAVPPSGSHAAVPPSGNYAAVPPTGSHAAVPPSGNYAAVPPTGSHAAVPPSGSHAALAPAPTSSHQVGETVGGRYRLERLLGCGALTETWEAVQVELERRVAVKFLRQHGGDVGDRMVEEARTVARIRHPHIVEFSDVGRGPDGQPYVVMELLDGETVAQVMARRSTLPWARAVSIAQQVADALTAAHRQSVVHRDLRPGNVFLVDTGEVADFVKVVDFGIARTGALGGTPSYMSPEQCRGEQLDPRSDVYAMGCLMFAMITGDPPFSGGTPEQIRARQIGEQPKTLSERAPRQFISEELEAVVARCLDKQPARRFADTRELSVELARIAQAAAAVSIAGAPVVRDEAGGSMSAPMSFAPRTPPTSGAEATQKAAEQSSTMPVVERPRAGLSTGAIVAIVAAVALLVGGFGVGVYVLVNKLIIEPARAAEREAASEGSRSEAEAAPSNEEGEAELEAPMAKDEAAPEREAAEADEPGAEAEAEAEAEEAPAPAPKASAGERKQRRSPAKPAAPAPKQDEAEGAQAEPAAAKPTSEPKSEAKGGINHEELVDPWG